MTPLELLGRPSKILAGVIVFQRPHVFRDARGTYDQIFDTPLHTAQGCPSVFMQDCVAVSRKDVLRGVHGDMSTWKLVTCLAGSFQLVVVDNRKDSTTYLKHTSFVLHGSDMLTAEHPIQVLVPPGFGNGHLILSESAMFHYKQSTSYDRGSQFTLRWDDPALRISWKLDGRQPILSERDANASLISL